MYYSHWRDSFHVCVCFCVFTPLVSVSEAARGRGGLLAKHTCGSAALPRAPPHHTPAEFIITAQAGWGIKCFYHPAVTHKETYRYSNRLCMRTCTHRKNRHRNTLLREKQRTWNQLLILYIHTYAHTLTHTQTRSSWWRKAASLVGSRSKCCWLIISWLLIAFLQPNKAERGTAFNTWWICG